MIAFFYEMVRNLKRKNRSVWKLVYKLNKVLVNILYPISQAYKKGTGIDADSKIIVSLTSFPDRINTVWITVASLLNQTMKPYKVILWLAEEQFPEREIPKSLLRLRERGLEICFCEDLKPHKKYFYTMQKYPEYYVITADDDIFYPENHIEQLWKGCVAHPGTIICQWSHLIGIDEQEGFQPYSSWTNNHLSVPLYRTLAVGCNGILYPPGSIPREAFVKEDVIRNALFTDDLWLKCMEIKNGRKTVNCNETILIYFNILAAQKNGLWKKNAGHDRENDKVWNRLMRLYPDVADKLREEA